MDGYYSQTHDQIFSRDIPVMTGFEKMSSSMGQIDNWGIEATLSATPVRTRDFSWYTGLTFWQSRNKLVHLYGEDLDGDGKEDDDIASSRFIGKSLGAIYGYVQDGIVQLDDYDYIRNTSTSTGTTGSRPKTAPSWATPRPTSNSTGATPSAGADGNSMR